MSEARSPAHSGWRRLLARRGTRIVLAIVLLLVVVRVALPAVPLAGLALPTPDGLVGVGAPERLSPTSTG